MLGLKLNHVSKKGDWGLRLYTALRHFLYRADYMYDVTNSGVEDFVASSRYLEYGWLIIA